MEAFKVFINTEFKVRDLGSPRDYLGMQVEHVQDAGVLRLHQSKYIKKICARYGVDVPDGSPTRPVAPMDYNLYLAPSADDETRCDPTLYRSITGACMYAAVAVRCDICHTVKQLSRYLTDPCDRHLAEAYKVLKYLALTHNVGLLYTNKPYTTLDGRTYPSGVLIGYCDASFAEDVVSRKSTSGYVFIKNNAAVSWAARSQSKVAHSSADAELRALDEAAREATWLQKLDAEFHPARDSKPRTIVLFEDNKPCIEQIKNPCQHSKVKHIDVPLKALRDDCTILNKFKLLYINTKHQIGDAFTKQLAPTLHWRLLSHAMNVRFPRFSIPQDLRAGNGHLTEPN
jgi:hypothetical protein